MTQTAPLTTIALSPKATKASCGTRAPEETALSSILTPQIPSNRCTDRGDSGEINGQTVSSPMWDMIRRKETVSSLRRRRSCPCTTTFLCVCSLAHDLANSHLATKTKKIQQNAWQRWQPQLPCHPPWSADQFCAWRTQTPVLCSSVTMRRTCHTCTPTPRQKNYNGARDFIPMCRLWVGE